MLEHWPQGVACKLASQIQFNGILFFSAMGPISTFAPIGMLDLG